MKVIVCKDEDADALLAKLRLLECARQEASK